MAIATPYILCFGFTQDSSRVPVTWDPRDALIKKWREWRPAFDIFISDKTQAEYPLRGTREKLALQHGEGDGLYFITDVVPCCGIYSFLFADAVPPLLLR